MCPAVSLQDEDEKEKVTLFEVKAVKEDPQPVSCYSGTSRVE